MTLRLEPLTLEGHHVRLEPLSLAHLDDLAQVAFDEEIWRWTSERALSPEELRAYVERALAAARTGSVLPFATVASAAGRTIGSTRFASFDVAGGESEAGETTGPRRLLRDHRPSYHRLRVSGGTPAK